MTGHRQTSHTLQRQRHHQNSELYMVSAYQNSHKQFNRPNNNNNNKKLNKTGLDSISACPITLTCRSSSPSVTKSSKRQKDIPLPQAQTQWTCPGNIFATKHTWQLDELPFSIPMLQQPRLAPVNRGLWTRLCSYKHTSAGRISQLMPCPRQWLSQTTDEEVRYKRKYSIWFLSWPPHSNPNTG